MMKVCISIYVESIFISLFLSTIRMAWYDLILEKAETSIINKNKCIEHLKNNNKVLGDQVNNLNKTHVSILSDLSKASKEKKTLEATLTN